MEGPVEVVQYFHDCLFGVQRITAGRIGRNHGISIRDPLPTKWVCYWAGFTPRAPVLRW